jgi:mercuric ion transport protein
MNIEVLYFEGCPNHEPAVKELKRALADLGIREPIHQIDVKDPEMAEDCKFLGSPSIRINEKDFFSNGDTDYSMRCRTYVIDGKLKGFPEREDIKREIRAIFGERPVEWAPKNEFVPPDHSKTIVKGATVGAVFTGIAASACCVGPVAFALLGISGAGALLKFQAYQPVFIPLTAAFLGTGFYFAYRKKGGCAPDSVCATPSGSRLTKIVLFAATGLVALFITFPYYAGYLF